MEIKKTYCDVDTMFRKIYERLATNEWKIEVLHGNTSEILSGWGKADSDFVKYGLDELLIEKNPKVNFPPSNDFDWTPIVAACFRREPENEYGEIPIDTPINERKDISQHVIGKPRETDDDLKFNENSPTPSAARHKFMLEWVFLKLQLLVDRKNGIDSRIKHISSLKIESMSQNDASNALWLSIRLHSVRMFELAQSKLGLNNHSSVQDSPVGFHWEEERLDETRAKDSLEMLDVAISFDNENFVAWWWKGFIFYKLGKYEDAEKCFKSSKSINPLWYPSLFYEGKMLVLRGYPNSGLEKINNALRQDPGRIAEKTFRARVLDAMGRYGDAIVDYDDAILLFEKKKKYPMEYLEFILYSKFIALEKSGYHDESIKTLNTLLELKHDQKLKEKFTESVKTKKISAQQISELEKEVGVIQDFVLTKDAEENIKKLVDILKKLTDFIYWSDQYFSKNGFEWIREACLENNSLDEVKILSGIERKEELLNRPFKRKMDQLKKFLNEKNIKFQVKVVSDDKLRERFHGRFLISKDVILTLPSVNNFNSGSMDVVSKVDITIKDTEFLEWWEKSMDYVKFRDENKDI